MWFLLRIWNYRRQAIFRVIGGRIDGSRSLPLFWPPQKAAATE